MSKFLKISKDTRLQDIIDRVGRSNVEYILAVNNLIWAPNIGEQLYDQQSAIANSTEVIDWQRKSSILNSFTSSSDTFESIALSSEADWRIISNTNALPGTLIIPDTVTLPSAVDIIGDNNPVSSTVYEQVMRNLQTPPHTIDPSVFNEYSTIKPVQLLDTSDATYQSSIFYQYFKIPWGEVTLYSDIDGESVDFPVYPEELSDDRLATYSTMPDMIYQYEPWYVYNSSGPRKNTYTFSFHRQMWSGDENDGMANNLIRFCQAQCYPNFNGAAVVGPRVTLYVAGSNLITGIMEDVSTDWDGPILSDGWYAHCTLKLTITEISKQALTYDSVRNLPLIG